MPDPQTKMNSSKKGALFEDKVYAVLDRAMQNQELGFAPGRFQLHRKRAYYSKDRNANIIVDISIDIFIKGQEQPSIVWIFECKDYSENIPVNDVEEFHSKLQQIGSDNTKGTIVTNVDLQTGALNYAQSHRIGVIR